MQLYYSQQNHRHEQLTFQLICYSDATRTTLSDVETLPPSLDNSSTTLKYQAQEASESP